MTATRKQSLTQEQLIKEIAQATKLSQDKVKHVLRQTSQTILTHSNKDQVVVLPDLGRFEKKTRPERTGINPKTKQKVTHPAKAYLSFRPSEQTRRTINSNLENQDKS